MASKVHVVPHFHWDREWYFTTEEFSLVASGSDYTSGNWQDFQNSANFQVAKQCMQ